MLVLGLSWELGLAYGELCSIARIENLGVSWHSHASLLHYEKYLTSSRTIFMHKFLFRILNLELESNLGKDLYILLYILSLSFP